MFFALIPPFIIINRYKHIPTEKETNNSTAIRTINSYPQSLYYRVVLITRIFRWCQACIIYAAGATPKRNKG